MRQTEPSDAFDSGRLRLWQSKTRLPRDPMGSYCPVPRTNSYVGARIRLLDQALSLSEPIQSAFPIPWP